MDADEMDIVEGQPGPSGAGKSSSSGKQPATWDASKPREESEVYKGCLTDQGFNIADYGDPLSTERPLGKVYSRPFPPGTEERLKGLVAQLQGAK